MDLFAIAASGMNAAHAQLNVAANNIANANTPGYAARRADLVAAPSGGVQVAAEQSTGQTVHLANELVGLRQAALLYGANAMVIKTADQVYGSVLNILDQQKRDSQPRQD
jgi:flagellar hook protein FlgE